MVSTISKSARLFEELVIGGVLNILQLLKSVAIVCVRKQRKESCNADENENWERNPREGH
jgi:hypothetical protein